MHALVDCDIFCYEFGHAKGEDGLPLEWNLVEWRIDQRLEQIMEATQASSWEGFLTGRGNFREQAATILPYKGNRDRGERPFWYTGVYNYLRDLDIVTVVDGIEADDAIADQHNEKDTIVCSRDKDFRQLSGWHYSWPGYNQQERPPYYINPIDASRFLYYQLLVGDQADNILGLYGVGDKAASVLRLRFLDSERDMYEMVFSEYEKRFGGYAERFFDENMKLLKLGTH